jgi:hypothetical protein
LTKDKLIEETNQTKNRLELKLIGYIPPSRVSFKGTLMIREWKKWFHVDGACQQIFGWFKENFDENL